MFECFPNLVYFFLYLSISLNIQAYEQKTKIPPKKQSDIVKMAEIFEKIFDRISGKDNLITKKSLVLALQNRSYKGSTAAMLAAVMFKYDQGSGFDLLAKLSNDEFGNERHISRKDIEAFRNTDEPKIMDAIRFFHKLHQNKVCPLDRNRNGFISWIELVAARRRCSNLREIKQLNFLIRKYHILRNASNDEWGEEKSGIHKKDILAYLENIRGKNHSKWNLAQKIAEQFRQMEKWLQHSHRKNPKRYLYMTQNPLDSIQALYVKQRHQGDCFYLAALAALAHRRPQDIFQMIRPMGVKRKSYNTIMRRKNMVDLVSASRYRVKFPGKRSIIVEAPSDGEIALGCPIDHGIWPLLLEKAYAQLLGRGKDNPYDAIDGSFWREKGVKAVTGHFANTDKNVYTDYKTMRRRLQRTWNHPNRLIIVAEIQGRKKSINKFGLVAGHMYAVIDYHRGNDEYTDQITIYNPQLNAKDFVPKGRLRPTRWEIKKKKAALNDGVFIMNLEEFNRHFTSITYELPRKKNIYPTIK